MVSEDDEPLVLLVDATVSVAVVLLTPSELDEGVVVEVSVAVELDAALLDAVVVTSVALVLVSSTAVDDELSLTVVVEDEEVVDAAGELLEVLEVVAEVVEACVSVLDSGDVLAAFEQARATNGQHSPYRTNEAGYRLQSLLMTVKPPLPSHAEKARAIWLAFWK